jgi:N-acylneuraminate cytidylyltransferase
MMSSIRVLGIIPARKGSKGLKNKNVYPVNGSPLIEYTLRAATESSCITDIVVTTDCDAAAQIASRYNAWIHSRPCDLATDEARSEAVIFDVIDRYSGDYDYLMLLQPTSPLRTSCHIAEALKIAVDSSVSSVISVCEADNSCLKYFFVEANHLKPISKPSYPFMPRQVLPTVYKPNGAIYVCEKATFLATGRLMQEDTLPYIMNEIESIDIDNYDDILRLEESLKNER